MMLADCTTSGVDLMGLVWLAWLMLMIMVLSMGFAALINTGWGRHFGVRGATIMAVGHSIVGFTLALFSLAEVVGSGCIVSLSLGCWFQVGTISVDWSMSLADPFLCAIVMGFLGTTVGHH